MLSIKNGYCFFYRWYHGAGEDYYSPAFYCPSGWRTAISIPVVFPSSKDVSAYLCYPAGLSAPPNQRIFDDLASQRCESRVTSGQVLTDLFVLESSSSIPDARTISRTTLGISSATMDVVANGIVIMWRPGDNPPVSRKRLSAGVYRRAIVRKSVSEYTTLFRCWLRFISSSIRIESTSETDRSRLPWRIISNRKRSCHSLEA